MISPKIQFRAVDGYHTKIRHTPNGTSRRNQNYQVRVDNQAIGKLVCFTPRAGDGKAIWTLDDELCDYLQIWLAPKSTRDPKNPMYGFRTNPTWPLKIMKAFVRHMITNEIRFPPEQNMHIDEIHKTVRFLEEKGEFVQ